MLIRALITGLLWDRVLTLGRGNADEKMHCLRNDLNFGDCFRPGFGFCPGSCGICFVGCELRHGNRQGRIDVGFGIEPSRQAACWARSATNLAASTRKNAAGGPSAFEESGQRHYGSPRHKPSAGCRSYVYQGYCDQVRPHRHAAFNAGPDSSPLGADKLQWP